MTQNTSEHLTTVHLDQLSNVTGGSKKAPAEPPKDAPGQVTGGTGAGLTGGVGHNPPHKPPPQTIGQKVDGIINIIRG